MKAGQQRGETGFRLGSSSLNKRQGHGGLSFLANETWADLGDWRNLGRLGLKNRGRPNKKEISYGVKVKCEGSGGCLPGRGGAEVTTTAPLNAPARRPAWADLLGSRGRRRRAAPSGLGRIPRHRATAWPPYLSLAGASPRAWADLDDCWPEFGA